VVDQQRACLIEVAVARQIAIECRADLMGVLADDSRSQNTVGKVRPEAATEN
jgi:hypothetical protein